MLCLGTGKLEKIDKPISPEQLISQSKQPEKVNSPRKIYHNKNLFFLHQMPEDRGHTEDTSWFTILKLT